MTEFVFVPEDFGYIDGNRDYDTMDAIDACRLANEKLRTWINRAPLVICRLDDNKWSCDEHSGFARATHKARLICIEKIL